MTDQKDPARVAAGLKATMQNPNVSMEAKHHAQEKLEQMGAADPESEHGVPVRYAPTAGEEHRVHQLAGYKAALHNPRVSEKGKAHAREVLEASGLQAEKEPEVSHEEHMTHVLAGYKAALNNPRVSQEAKAHAREFLESQGAL
ncbi:hypothetical protein EWM64_g5060 [Hericium alpestre]|uniref:Conidiation protein 6 n=1 Tax=Hericium alpestre TaxID=135208 RepID=A0A4Y9ZY07_9AGAM|nr:hypothetical protein EWM64_g5060 [Hericium alpestre]